MFKLVCSGGSGNAVSTLVSGGGGEMLCPHLFLVVEVEMLCPHLLVAVEVEILCPHLFLVVEVKCCVHTC